MSRSKMPLSTVHSYVSKLSKYLREMFVGAYAVEYTEQRTRGEWDIEAAVKRACRAAMLELDHPGCIHHVPWADDVDHLEDEISSNST